MDFQPWMVPMSRDTQVQTCSQDKQNFCIQNVLHKPNDGIWMIAEPDMMFNSIPVKSHALAWDSCFKASNHAHPHYSHSNTTIDELENFSKDNKTA